MFSAKPAGKAVRARPAKAVSAMMSAMNRSPLWARVVAAQSQDSRCAASRALADPPGAHDRARRVAAARGAEHLPQPAHGAHVTRGAALRARVCGLSASVSECGLDLGRRDVIEVDAEPAPLLGRERQVDARACNPLGEALDDRTPARINFDAHEGKLST